MPSTPSNRQRGAFVVDENIGVGLLFSTLFNQRKRNMTLVASNLYSAQKTYEFLLNFFSEDEVIFFPSDELLRAEALSSSKELLSQRLYAMGKLLSNGKHILVTHPAALLRYLPKKEHFSQAIIKIKAGDKIDIGVLKQKLSELGYLKVNKIDQSLQFASRGDVLDVFSLSSQKPYRIEFFDDQIESIRTFDISTQLSVENISEAVIFPASDMCVNEEEREDLANKMSTALLRDCAELSEEASSILKENVSRDIEDILSNNIKPYLYKYYCLSDEVPTSILDYIDSELIMIANREQFAQSSDLLINESGSYFSELRKQMRIVRGLRAYMSVEEAFNGKIKPIYGTRFAKNESDVLFSVRNVTSAGTGLTAVVNTILSYIQTSEKLIIAINDQQQLETIKSLLDENGQTYEFVDGFSLPNGKIGLIKTNLSEGFELPSLKITYLTSTELFGRNVKASRYTSRFMNSTILRSYEDLRPGDYVVHEYKGVGQFLSVETLEINNAHHDYLHIAYAGDESLYVPLEQFRLVRKYSGREGARPKLSNLSRGDWNKKKAQIKEKIDDLADRLIKLYGTRLKIDGYAFPEDDEFQKRFESEFPYSLTDDQARSLREIKDDMEAPIVMDRLLCGDVGFGKTEIAFRAAFKALLAGKQVALLCPTTLLARQHYEVALQRFNGYGVKLALLSRMVPEGEQKTILKELKMGNIHFVIGTHRLLSKEVGFKDLGLLIIDEEQRFGVEQKERIKEMANRIDVLSLSATPIPRTLQMSLVGLRALSQINTPPNNRMPIQTYVAPFTKEVVSELISRELGRNGQVFYVHNRVDSIYAKAEWISRSVMGAVVGVVHGQMQREETEAVMEDFYEGKVNVLVATSIIENGIDVPNANLIIVEDADRFGLSQLYQIKGRVGRGSRISYAYLFYKENKNMNEDAQKRLKAIQDFTELGSGYKIAQRDLMIRGAGDILGAEQAGFIDSIGLDLYLKMLQESLTERQTGKKIVPPKPNKMLPIDAFFPEEYVPSGDKVALYQELSDCMDDASINKFKRKLRDVYGKLPPQVELLIQKRRIDAMLNHSEFVSLDKMGNEMVLLLSEGWTSINGIGVELFEQMVPYLEDARLSFYEKKLQIRVKMTNDWISKMEGILRVIRKLSDEHGYK